MTPGNIVEYIDRQKIVCAAVLEIKNERLRLLTENSREVKLSAARLSHKGKMSVSLSSGRDRISDFLKERVNRRKALAQEIDIRELWEVLSSEQEWIDLQTMTAFCFSDSPTEDHESAVIRAFFADRMYFRFSQDQFFPYTEEQVAQVTAKAREEARRQRIMENGGAWIRSVLSDPDSGPARPALTEEQQEWISILQSCYLFEKESPHWELGRAMAAGAGISEMENLFRFFVKLGIWNPDENIDLRRYGVPTDFPEKVMESTLSRIRFFETEAAGRKDLTGLPIITIDGQATLDFDDALSLEKKEDHYVLGVHIADVGHFVEKGSPVDREAIQRGSSIYMPDRRISMLPQCLAEDHCSLKAGELRPATSTLIRLRPSGDIIGSEVCSSIIRVTRQLTYHEVNCMVEEDGDIAILHEIARQFRKKRLGDGAVHISLPEINIWVDENGQLAVTRINRESPGRMLVAEIMIMANWINARFLAENRMAAIFRSQPGPRERLYREDEGTLFQNWMQRKLLSRFVLSTQPEHHSGLGLDAYVTVTSPIRKYSDLITQRQIRAVFGLDSPYSQAEVQQTIYALEQPMSCVSKLQNRRKHYWLLKYLEGKTGQKEEAIVLGKRRNTYQVLMTEYMTECTIPASGGINLKPEDVIQVTIQHVDARKEILNVFMG